MKPDFPVPHHVAVIMDGNGRWARRSGLERLRGHHAGAEAVRDVVEAAAEWGIANLTLYAFSNENWSRTQAETSALMGLLQRFLGKEEEGLVRNQIRLLGLGALEDLPSPALKQLQRTEEATASGDRMTLRLALSYGGRQEIVAAMQALATQVAAGELNPADLDEAAVAAHLHHPDMPDPDLVIRTAGEQRLSNFLLWQASYAEFYFTPVLWPDFRRQDFLLALRDYHGRVRRFGDIPQEEKATPFPVEE